MEIEPTQMADEDQSSGWSDSERNLMMLRFLEGLYGDCALEYLNLWTKQDKKTYSFRIEDRQKIVDTALSLSEEMDVYFCVGLHSVELPIGKRGTSETVTVIPGLWMDVDIKDPSHRKIELPESVDEAIGFLNSRSKKPSLMVNSGGGLHAYWLFDEPHRIADASDRQKCRTISKNFQESIIKEGKDHGWNLDNTSDLARILRLPGTWNRKKEEPRLVFVLESI